MAEGLSKNQLAARAELEDLAQELKEPTPSISMLPFSVPAPQPARIIITAATDMAQPILSQEPFSPFSFHVWILKGVEDARKQLAAAGPNAPEAIHINRRIFEFLDASTQARMINTKEEAVKLLADIDAWETRNANPKNTDPRTLYPRKVGRKREALEKEKKSNRGEKTMQRKAWEEEQRERRLEERVARKDVVKDKITIADVRKEMADATEAPSCAKVDEKENKVRTQVWLEKQMEMSLEERAVWKAARGL